MDTAAVVPLSIERALEDFFASSRVLRHPALWLRAHGVRRNLEDYLDAECERWLTEDEMTLVHAERQIHAPGAVARVTGPEALVYALPGFLVGRWVPDDRAVARVQLMVVAELVEFLRADRVVDVRQLSCGLLEVESAVSRARRRLGGHPVD